MTKVAASYIVEGLKGDFARRRKQMAAKLSDLSAEDLAEMFDYLDELRASGATNMFGARPYLQDEYPQHEAVARHVLSAWMNTFDPEKSADQRADTALLAA